MKYDNKNYNLNPFTMYGPESAILASLDFLTDMSVSTLFSLYPELSDTSSNNIHTSASNHAQRIINTCVFLQNLIKEYPQSLLEEKKELFSSPHQSDIPF